MKNLSYKRILSAVLAVLILISSIPGSAFAEGGVKLATLKTFSFGEARQDPNVTGNMVTSKMYPEVVEIRGEVTVGATVWYQLYAAEGYYWPEITNAADGWWLESKWVEIIETPAPETTAPSVPETTVPETTVPETTVPETTAPVVTDPSIPETTAPIVTEPEETVPETTAPVVTEPEETVPETTAPVVTEPEETVPETTAPVVTEPEETVPETTAPVVTEPEETIPETTAPTVQEPLVDENTGITVQGAPEGATLSVSIPTVGGEALPNVFDIKVYDENGNEWQPIDEGKTVTISIPVTGVKDGEYVDVYHFVDYAADIDGDETILPIEGATAEELAILRPAIDAYGDGVHVAVEIMYHVPVCAGMAVVETDSFSVYTPDYLDMGESFTVSFTSSSHSDPANEKTYYATVGQTIVFTFRYESGQSHVNDQNGSYSLVRLADNAPISVSTVEEREKIKTGSILGIPTYDYFITEKTTVTFSKESLGLTEDPKPGELFQINWKTGKNYEGKNPRWTRVRIVGEYNTTFKLNGGQWTDGTTADLPKTIISYQPVSVVPTPTRPGYKFLGWSNVQDGAGGTLYTPDGQFPATLVQGGTLYAMWEAVEYAVSYVLPGGVANASVFENQTKKHDIALALHSETPQDIDDNTKFLGWDTNGDGTLDISKDQWEDRETYPNGYLYSENADVTLISLWDDAVYSIIYNANGGQTVPGNQYLDTSKDISISLTKELPTRVGYEFVGWNTAVDGSGKAYDTRNIEYTLTTDDFGGKNLTLYAQWEIIYYAIKFDSNGGDGSMGYMTMLTYDNLTSTFWYTNYYANLTANAFTPPSNQKFTGWALTDVDADNDIVQFTDGENVKMSNLLSLAGIEISEPTELIVSNGEESHKFKDTDGEYRYKYNHRIITLHAVWAQSTYTIKYVSTDTDTGVSITNLTQTVILENWANTNINSNATRTRYTFAGWKANDGKIYQYGGQVPQGTADATITLTATWQANIVGYMCEMVDGSPSLRGTVSIGANTNGTGYYTLPMGVNGSDTYPAITFTIPDGYEVDYVQVDGTNSTEYTLTDNELVYNAKKDQQVTAPLFVAVVLKKLPTYTITAYIDNGGSMTGNAGTYDHGSSAKVSFAPATGYEITGVTVNNVAQTNFTESSYVYSATMTADVNIVVTTAKETYTITYMDGVNELTNTGNPASYTFEDEIDLIDLPDKTGYTFKGWYESADFSGDPITKIENATGNKTLYAKWKINTHTVNYVAGDMGDAAQNMPANTTQNYNETFNLSTTVPTSETHDFIGWSYNGTTYQPGASITMPDADVTLIAQWTIKSYSVIFKDHDGAVLDTQTVNHGSAATAPSAPTREGHTFTGWNKDFSNVTGDLTVIAQYTINSYKVTWDVDGTKTEVDYVYGATIVKPANPTKEGYTFAGWDPEVPETMPASDQTFTAQWKAQYAYQLNFNANAGSDTVSGMPENQTATWGDATSYTFNWTNVPTRQGYTFMGWSTDKTATTGNKNTSYTVTGVAANTAAVTLYAVWEINKHDVVYAGENITIPKEEVAYGTYVTVKAPGNRTGYGFDGWNVTGLAGVSKLQSGEAFTMPDNDVTLTAIWTAKDCKYDIVYKSSSGLILGTTEVTKNFDTTHPITAPAMNGYETPAVQTVKWDAESKTIEFVYTPIQYTIVCKDGEKTLSSANYTIESKEITISDPTKTGYTFIGWTGTGLTEATKSLTVPKGSTGNREYVATWAINSYVVTWKNEDGTVLETDNNVAYGTTPTYDGATPTKAATAQYTYTFDGWSPAISAVTDDVVYTATYSSTANRYTITFKTNGGTEIAAITQDYGTAVTAPADPTKTGYTFAGWDKEIPATMPAENVTITASWTVKQYTITYDLADGALAEGAANPSTYTIESDDITLINPTKEGFTFLGWTGSNGTTAQDSVTIAKGSTGDKSYTAVWGVKLTASIGNTADGQTGTITIGTEMATNPVEKIYEMTEAVNLVGTKISFEPLVGYRIIAVTVNGVPVEDKEFTDSSYTYTVPEGGLTQNTEIVVTTEKILVEIKVIVIGSGESTQEITVLEGSDVLIAVTPGEGNSLQSVAVTQDDVTNTINKVSAGYIFTAADLEKNVNITITAKTDDIHVLVGAVEKGCVELIYGSETVTTANAASAADKYVPLASTYEMKLDSDEGWYIDSVKKVNQETESFGEATYTVSNATMNADASYIGTSARCYKIEFATGDGPALETIYAKEDELVTLQAPGQWVDGKFDYWYCDLDGDGKQETYRAGDIFTMPAKDVTLVANWRESEIRIGINMAYHIDGAQYKYLYADGGEYDREDAYHQFPKEPGRLDLTALCAYLKSDNTWNVDNSSWEVYMQGKKPSAYLSSDILTYEHFVSQRGYQGICDPDVYSRRDTNGDLIKRYFKFDWTGFDPNSNENKANDELNDAVYNELIEAWLKFCTKPSIKYQNTDIPWESVLLQTDLTDDVTESNGLTRDDFKVVPYVIKRRDDGNWFVEVVILAEVKHTLTYNLNMDEGYSGATQPKEQWYGDKYQVKAAADPGQITKTVNDVTYTGVFQYWLGSDGKTYEAGETIIMTQNLTLTAVWKYYAPVTISQTGVAGTDTAFYQISGDGVNTTVAISGEGFAKVMLPVGVAYTVTPQTDWTWNYSVSEGDDSVISETITVSDTGSNTVSFAYKSKNSGWLHGENHN